MGGESERGEQLTERAGGFFKPSDRCALLLLPAALLLTLPRAAAADRVGEVYFGETRTCVYVWRKERLRLGGRAIGLYFCNKPYLAIPFL